MSSSTQVSLYERVTDRIVAALEKGVVPWQKPWVSGAHRNAISGRRYRGVNVLSLELTALERGYRCPAWLTFKQACEAGGYVRKGERGTLVIWYERRQRTHGDTEEREEPDSLQNDEWIWLAKSFWLFNVEQCSGLDALRESLEGRFDFEPLEKCEQVLTVSGALINYGGGAAFYDRRRDTITLPHPTTFLHPACFFAVAFHELTHWTGAPHRLGREQSCRFGDEIYAFEELVAELGAAFVSAYVGIEHVSQASAYLSSWLAVLKNDKRAIFTAAKLATAAADYLTNRQSSPECEGISSSNE